MKFLLPTSVFLSVYSVHFLMHEFPLLPNRFQYMPDIAIAGVAAVVIARLVATRRFTLLPLRYWLIFLVFVYVVVSGLVLNSVAPEVTFAGIRFYFKYVPLFLLPFAFDYSQADVKRLFFFLVGLALIQVPLSLRQRFFEYADLMTGDVITGSLASSTSLTLFGIGMIVMMVVLYLDKVVSLKAAIALGLLFIVPATINETKVTPIVLGVGALGVLFARRRTIDSRQLGLISLAGFLLVGAFVLVYDRLYTAPGGANFVEFMTENQGGLDNYMLRGVKAKPFSVTREHPDIVAKPVRLTEQETWIGRFDAVQMPFTVMANDGVHLLLGLGVGNVSSGFGDGGRYTNLAEKLGATGTTLTQLLWETGLLGALLGIALLCMLARDSLSLSNRNSEWATLGAGWFGVLLVLLSTLAYTNLIGLPELTALVAFFSGTVVAKLKAESRIGWPVRLVEVRANPPSSGVSRAAGSHRRSSRSHI